ncbi:MAG: hypothetical protein KDJ15_03050 [Alphaproteobacteria bacterium]|nr:hypothetical protein [Alphaproteobacteria bacterium]
MTRQSTNHIFLISPAVFYLNPETAETNVYQLDGNESEEETYHHALGEFRQFQNMLVKNKIAVTVMEGERACPDHIFPNWASTHIMPDGRRGLALYPMLNANRRAERTPAMIAFLSRTYDTVLDFRAREEDGLFLEATGSLCLDRVNKVAYAALSARTDAGLAQEWADHMGYELLTFETRSHTGKPVYHTDLVMFIGTEVAGVCFACMTDEGARQAVRARLSRTHEIVDLTAAQQQAFCGNSLEVVNADGDRLLVMSDAAFRALRPDQIETFGRFFDRIIHSALPTMERYGGGSARCLMMEMF